ncbi:hypothetical protein EDB89DRAFT_2025670 [Lactarius sanguifluus]|nr:hypothetical protein EDB89DRAFT_2025670 [Lactarius sanguifluus]
MHVPQCLYFFLSIRTCAETIRESVTSTILGVASSYLYPLFLVCRTITEEWYIQWEWTPSGPVYTRTKPRHCIRGVHSVYRNHNVDCQRSSNEPTGVDL